MDNLAKKFICINLCFWICTNIAYSSEQTANGLFGVYSLDVLKVILSLVLVLIIFFFGITVFKKYLAGPIKSNSTIKVLGGYSLGPKEKLVLVEAGNVNLLLGVTSSGINRLYKFSESELDLNEQKLDEKQNGLLSFSSHLEKIIRKSET